MAILQPRKEKHRKQFRGKRRGLALRGSTLTFGFYGLKAKERGQMLTDVEVQEVAEVPAKRLDVALRKWFMRHRGIVIRHEKVGFYLLTSQEQAGCPAQEVRKARKSYKRGTERGLAIDPNTLDDNQRESLNRQMRIVAVQLQVATDALNQIRFELGQGGKPPNKLSQNWTPYGLPHT